MTDLISHCTTEVAGLGLILEVEQVKTNLYELDSGTMTYWSLNPDALVEGMADPTYPGLDIEEITKTRNGEIWEFACAVSGIKGAKAPRRVKEGYRKMTPLGDFDGFEDTWLTPNENHFVKGQRVGSFVCYNVSSVERTSNLNWWKVTGQFAGLHSMRPPTRVVSCNGHVVTGDRLKVTLENGWNDFRKGQASFPKLVVTDTQHTTSPPPTNAVPGNRVPLNAPPIRNIPFSGTDLRYYWPRGWSFTCGYRQPFGIDVPLYIVDYIHEWIPMALPS